VELAGAAVAFSPPEADEELEEDESAEPADDDPLSLAAAGAEDDVPLDEPLPRLSVR
jgi:hypothetical protein